MEGLQGCSCFGGSNVAVRPARPALPHGRNPAPAPKPATTTTGGYAPPRHRDDRRPLSSSGFPSSSFPCSPSSPSRQSRVVVSEGERDAPRRRASSPASSSSLRAVVIAPKDEEDDEGQHHHHHHQQKQAGVLVVSSSSPSPPPRGYERRRRRRRQEVEEEEGRESNFGAGRTRSPESFSSRAARGGVSSSSGQKGEEKNVLQGGSEDDFSEGHRRQGAPPRSRRLMGENQQFGRKEGEKAPEGHEEDRSADWRQNPPSSLEELSEDPPRLPLFSPHPSSHRQQSLFLPSSPLASSSSSSSSSSRPVALGSSRLASSSSFSCFFTYQQDELPPCFWIAPWRPRPIHFFLTRFLFLFLYFVVADVLMNFGSVTSDYLYSKNPQPKLQDRFHDWILGGKPVPGVSVTVPDFLAVSLLFITGVRHVFFIRMPLNLLIFYRFMFLLSSVYVIRGIAIFLTTMPTPVVDCKVADIKTAWDFIRHVLKAASFQASLCTDMIISGHTSSTCLCMATWLYYSNCNRYDSAERGDLIPFYYLLAQIRRGCRYVFGKTLCRRKGKAGERDSGRRRKGEEGGGEAGNALEDVGGGGEVGGEDGRIGKDGGLRGKAEEETGGVKRKKSEGRGEEEEEVGGEGLGVELGRMKKGRRDQHLYEKMSQGHLVHAHHRNLLDFSFLRRKKEDDFVVMIGDTPPDEEGGEGERGRNQVNSSRSAGGPKKKKKKADEEQKKESGDRHGGEWRVGAPKREEEEEEEDGEGRDVRPSQADGEEKNRLYSGSAYAGSTREEEEEEKAEEEEKSDEKKKRSADAVEEEGRQGGPKRYPSPSPQQKGVEFLISSASELHSLREEVETGDRQKKFTFQREGNHFAARLSFPPNEAETGHEYFNPPLRNGGEGRDEGEGEGRGADGEEKREKTKKKVSSNGHSVSSSSAAYEQSRLLMSGKTPARTRGGEEEEEEKNESEREGEKGRKKRSSGKEDVAVMRRNASSGLHAGGKVEGERERRASVFSACARYLSRCYGAVRTCNLLGVYCLLHGVVTIVFIDLTFIHYTVDICFGILVVFALFTAYHMILSLIWAERNQILISRRGRYCGRGGGGKEAEDAFAGREREGGRSRRRRRRTRATKMSRRSGPFISSTSSSASSWEESLSTRREQREPSRGGGGGEAERAAGGLRRRAASDPVREAQEKEMKKKKRKTPRFSIEDDQKNLRVVRGGEVEEEERGGLENNGKKEKERVEYRFLGIAERFSSPTSSLECQQGSPSKESSPKLSGEEEREEDEEDRQRTPAKTTGKENRDEKKERTLDEASSHFVPTKTREEEGEQTKRPWRVEDPLLPLRGASPGEPARREGKDDELGGRTSPGRGRPSSGTRRRKTPPGVEGNKKATSPERGEDEEEEEELTSTDLPSYSLPVDYHGGGEDSHRREEESEKPWKLSLLSPPPTSYSRRPPRASSSSSSPRSPGVASVRSPSLLESLSGEDVSDPYSYSSTAVLNFPLIRLFSYFVRRFEGLDFQD